MVKQAKQIASKKQAASRALSNMFLLNISEILSEYTALYPQKIIYFLVNVVRT
jgi:hypothetical protein